MVNKVFAVSANSGRGIDAIRTYLKDSLPQVLNLNPNLKPSTLNRKPILTHLTN
jgi:selenocysteine-specific translation elongation factor